MGPQAYRFVDFLEETGQSLWQVLPIGPCGKGNSPYMTYASSAGNPLLVSPELLYDDQLIDHDALSSAPASVPDTIDYPTVTTWKESLLRVAHERFHTHASESMRLQYCGFCRGNTHWLDDYALFMAISNAEDKAPWIHWSAPIRHRTTKALEAYQQQLRKEIDYHKFTQYIFFRQWFSLRQYANAQGVRIVGDLPIYVGHSSADVWAHQELFMLDSSSGEATEVAGVPPDYFSETGQLWGNPVYNWDRSLKTDFQWWRHRVWQATRYFDLVRLDHFRGLESYWSIPANETTAIKGRWIKAPGHELLVLLRRDLARLPIIAEDLGVISPEVIQLRDRFRLPGMKVLHFAFGSDRDNIFLPIHYTRNCVVYTGTHDNNTTLGWLRQDTSQAEKSYLSRYIGCEINQDPVWSLIRLAMSSVADRVIIPLQDVLELDESSRMNTPGKPQDNWTWRFQMKDLDTDRRAKLRQHAIDYARTQANR